MAFCAASDTQHQARISIVVKNLSQWLPSSWFLYRKSKKIKEKKLFNDKILWPCAAVNLWSSSHSLEFAFHVQLQPLLVLRVALWDLSKAEKQNPEQDRVPVQLEKGMLLFLTTWEIGIMKSTI